MQLKRAARVILVGAPGVGKGTQSERLLKRFPQLKAISTGDLLRRNVKNRTPLGIMAENTIKSGGLVADDLMLRLISGELRSRGWLFGGRPPVMTLSAEATSTDGSYHPGSSMDGFNPLPFQIDEHAVPHASEDPSASFMLDGYPRTVAQAATLDKIVPMNLVVSIQTPFSVILERIAGRWVHEPSGRVYNTTFNRPRVPGRDDVTGEPLVQRPDDNEETYRARFRKFQENSEPLLNHYAKKGVLLEVEGMSSDEISPKLYEAFERRFAR
ncbi:adenylate kinase [Trichoderma cornu-damae]|uniref:GTP:AMP phosphotransferase, mitochondrial n=1 Tax=Trichoderma cornu-damae TaxID=654480 RepID=A0A9P8QTJ0_9HYPO|nr:adenylate kinase [Trichoderma cornu-damae]